MKLPLSKLLLGQSENPSKEQGSILVLFVFMMVLMMALAGLAIDAGHLFRAKSRFQHAADAGALAGIGYTILQKQTPGFPTQEVVLEPLIEAIAAEIAIENLLLNEFDPALIDASDPCANDPLIPHKIQVCADYNRTTLNLNVEITQDVDVMLMDLVVFPLFGVGNAQGRVDVASNANSRRRPANVQLVLDYSASMDCPSVGPCTCQQPVAGPDCDALGVQQKYQDLQFAVNRFLSSFDDTRDRVGLTLFNIATKTPVQITNIAANGFTESAFTNELLDVVNNSPAAGTNITAGLIAAYMDASNAGIVGQEEVNYVVFTDGAPTATKLLVKNPDASLDINDLGIGEHDYTLYKLDWGIAEAPPNPAQNWQGPSPLVKSQFFTFGTESYYSNLANILPLAGIPAGCTPIPVPSDPTQYNTMVSSCLVNLEFHMPNASGITAGSDYGNGSNPFGPKPFRFFYEQQFFNAAVATADYLRAQGGHIFTIGLGPDDLGAWPSGDPYQFDQGEHGRRDIFNSRLANDYLEAKKLAVVHPEPSFTNYQSYDLWHSKPVRRQGRYMSTPDPSELDELFSAMAVKIILRLTT